MANVAEEPMAVPPQGEQVFTTEGIKPLGRPVWHVRMFMAIVEAAERLNRRYSKVGNPSVYENAVFPWVAAIESEWRATENSRRAKYYILTDPGRRTLKSETEEWQRQIAAIARILEA